MHPLLKDKKAVFLDIGYTLDYPMSGDWVFTKKFHEYADENFLKCSEEQIQRARDKGQTYFQKTHLLSTLKEEEENYLGHYKILNDELHLCLDEKQLREIAHDRAYNISNYGMLPDTYETVKELSKHFILGTISDTWPSVYEQLEMMNIKEYFNFFTFSYELGVFKPDKKIYLDALKKSGCKPEECVFVDDTYRCLKGAEQCGITAICINSHNNVVQDCEFSVIQRLKELLD